MVSYIVRIYRCGPDGPIGTLVSPDGDRSSPFRSADELWSALADCGRECDRKPHITGGKEDEQE